MSSVRDLHPSRFGAFAILPNIRAIGWLSGASDFPTGTVPDEFLERLTAYHRALQEGHSCPVHGREFSLLPLASAGRHECELCLRDGVNPFRDSMEIYVPDGDGGGFEAPAMIVHYIESHHYQPPPEFVDAVLGVGTLEDLFTSVASASDAALELWRQRRLEGDSGGG